MIEEATNGIKDVVEKAKKVAGLEKKHAELTKTADPAIDQLEIKVNKELAKSKKIPEMEKALAAVGEVAKTVPSLETRVNALNDQLMKCKAHDV